MSRAGRKRNVAAERYACGKIKPPKPPPPPDQPHRKGYGPDPLAETVHGRYYLDGSISEAQHAAGSFFGRSRLRYRTAIGSPDSLRSRFEGHRDHLTGEDDARYIAEYLSARALLGKLVVDVEWVVVQDAMLADLANYRSGLDVLRKLYRV